MSIRSDACEGISCRVTIFRLVSIKAQCPSYQCYAVAEHFELEVPLHANRLLTLLATSIVEGRSIYMQHAASVEQIEAHLELLVRFSDSPPIRFLAPLMAIFAKEPDRPPIEQE